MNSLQAYANLLEMGSRRPGLPLAEEAKLLKAVALFRSMTPEEANDLLKHRLYPDRLASLADAVGLSIEECRSMLAGALRNLREGLHARPGANEPVSPQTPRFRGKTNQ